MKDQISDLNQLLKKFKSEVEALEKQIEEKTTNIRIVYEALKLLQDEMSTQPALVKFSIPKVITESLSEKYKGVGINKAIVDILSNSPAQYLDGKTVFEELIKNGFTSASSNKKRDVYISLYRLNRDNKIVSVEDEGLKKYSIKRT